MVAGIARAGAPGTVIGLVLLTVVGGVAPSVSAWLNRAVINGLVPGGAASGQVAHHGPSAGSITMLAVALGGVGLAMAGVMHARQYAEAELRRTLDVIVQERLSAAINSFPGMSRFESPAFADRLQLAQQMGRSGPATFVVSGLGCAQSLITAVGMFITLWVINPVLALVVAATAVPAMAAQVATSRRRVDLELRASPAMRRQMFYSRLLVDRVAAKEVRLFGLGDYFRNRAIDELRSHHGHQRSVDRKKLAAQGSLALLSAVVAGGGLTWTIHQAAAGRMPVGDVTMFAIAVVGVQSAISTVVTKLAETYQTLLTIDHYEAVVTAGPDLTLASEPRQLPGLREGIEFRDVWFRYHERHAWVLSGLTLFIPRGTSVALVGLNGAGKSTLVKLLCRFYDPERGSIRWDGVDIRDVAPAELRRRIGAVFQDYMAYDLIAAENIGLGDLDRIDDRDGITHAAERADIHDALTRLPDGYDTMLSRIFFGRKDKEDASTGVVLSGGQWQRLALARGFMRADRDLLILDEPSSGLDAEAEHAIHQRLLTLRTGRTSLLISHRLGAVRDADTIFVISGGRVVERGTHEELMATGGEYQRLFALQASGYNDRPVPSGAAPVARRAPVTTPMGQQG